MDEFCIDEWRKVSAEYNRKVAALGGKPPQFEQAVDIFETCPNLREGFWNPSLAHFRIDMLVYELAGRSYDDNFKSLPINLSELTPELEIDIHVHEHKHSVPHWKEEKVNLLLKAAETNADAYDALLTLCRRWLNGQSPFLPAIHGSLTEMANQGLIETKRLELPMRVKAWLDRHLASPSRPRGKKKNRLQGRDKNFQMSLWKMEKLGFRAGRNRETKQPAGIDALLAAIERLKASSAIPVDAQIPTIQTIEGIWSKVGKEEKTYPKPMSEK